MFISIRVLFYLAASLANNGRASKIGCHNPAGRPAIKSDDRLKLVNDPGG